MNACLFVILFSTIFTNTNQAALVFSKDTVYEWRVYDSVIVQNNSDTALTIDSIIPVLDTNLFDHFGVSFLGIDNGSYHGYGYDYFRCWPCPDTWVFVPHRPWIFSEFHIDGCISCPVKKLAGPVAGDTMKAALLFHHKTAIDTLFLIGLFTGYGGRIEFKNTAAQNRVDIYPNPFNSSVTIQMNKPGKYAARIYNVSGKLIFDKSVYSKLIWNPDKLESGVYILKIKYGANNTITKRLLYFK